MGSQFVDLNSDGHVDILTATFDGSPHVSFGTADGFSKPQRLKDVEGRRIIISSIWNYDSKKHEDLGYAMADGKPRNERCISALAFDWDRDGDKDLLLGSYEAGHLYLQINTGTDAKPAYSGKNIPIEAGGKPIAFAAKMTAPRLIDWDSDGDLDLLVGTFGNATGKTGPSGSVHLAINEADAKSPPVFGPLQTLIAPRKGKAHEPTRPDSGLYLDVADYDQDGDLDLVVGGYSSWTPKQRKLTAEEEARAAELQAKNKAHGVKFREFYSRRSAAMKEATAGLDRKSDEYRTKRAGIYDEFRAEDAKLTEELNILNEELFKLVPKATRESFVWIYERH